MNVDVHEFDTPIVDLQFFVDPKSLENRTYCITAGKDKTAKVRSHQGSDSATFLRLSADCLGTRPRRSQDLRSRYTSQHRLDHACERLRHPGRWTSRHGRDHDLGTPG